MQASSVADDANKQASAAYSDAYKVLSDDSERAAYDKQRLASQVPPWPIVAPGSWILSIGPCFKHLIANVVLLQEGILRIIMIYSELQAGKDKERASKAATDTLDSVKETADQASAQGSKAGSAAGSASEKANQTASQASDKAKGLKDDAQKKAEPAINKAGR